MVNKPETKKKECMVEKKRKKRERKTTFSEKKEEARHVSEQWDKGWINIIHVHNTTHLASDNTAGQQTLMNYPTQRKNERAR